VSQHAPSWQIEAAGMGLTVQAGPKRSSACYPSAPEPSRAQAQTNFVRHGSGLSVGGRRIAPSGSQVVEVVGLGSTDIARDEAKHQGSVADEFAHLLVSDARTAHSSADLQSERRSTWLK
jgi:hypothetical protein